MKTMNKMFMKLLEKKKAMGESLPTHVKNAKMALLQQLKKDMLEGDGEMIKGGMKKVTVAAPDKAGLKEGLKKAESMLPEEMDSEETSDGMCPECGMNHMDGVHDTKEEEASEESEMSTEEIDAEIKRLEMLKKAKLG